MCYLGTTLTVPIQSNLRLLAFLGLDLAGRGRHVGQCMKRCDSKRIMTAGAGLRYQVNWQLQSVAGLMPKESRDGLPTFLISVSPHLSLAYQIRSAGLIRPSSVLHKIGHLFLPMVKGVVVYIFLAMKIHALARSNCI